MRERKNEGHSCVLPHARAPFIPSPEICDSLRYRLDDYYPSEPLHVAEAAGGRDEIIWFVTGLFDLFWNTLPEKEADHGPALNDLRPRAPARLALRIGRRPGYHKLR